MAQAWQPQEAGVLQLCQLLAEFQRPGADQAQILQQLEQCSHVPDFNCYLSFIFANGDAFPAEVRQSAGLLLKNNLKQQYTALPQEQRSLIQQHMLLVLPHPTKALRHTAGSIIAAIVAASGLASWPDLVLAMGHGLGSAEPHTVDGALDALYKILEDAPLQIDIKATVPNVPQPQSVSLLLVPPLLALMASPHVDVRRHAVSTLNLMLNTMPAGMLANIESFTQGLFTLATDSAAAVRREVCIGLCSILQARPDLLMPQLPALVEYMLVSNQDGDEGVALESAEFWMAFCDTELEPGLLRPFLPKLVPVLMNNMVYDEYDDEVADAEAAEEAALAAGTWRTAKQVDDADKDVKPLHHTRRGGGGGGGGDGEGGEDDGDDDDEEGVRAWNLRKCSAAGLDMLSNVFADELLPVLLPIVEQRLQEGDWRRRESAILALGAVSEGCHMGLAPHLPSMVEMLLPRLEDARPMVRIITCWALSRYSHWVLMPPEAGGMYVPPPPQQHQQQQQQGGSPAQPQQSQPQQQPAEQLFSCVLSGVLKRVLDHNRHVQDAACSALAQLEEHAGASTRGAALQPHLPLVVDALATAARQYGRRNQKVLYDAIITLLNVVGPALGDPALSQWLLPPLFDRWERVSPVEREAIPMMECFAVLATSLRQAFERFAKPVFDKGMQIIALQLRAKRAVADGGGAAASGFAAAAAELRNGGSGGGTGVRKAAAAAGAAAAGKNQPHVTYDRELLVCGLDLMGGLADGLRASMDPLAASAPLVDVVAACCADSHPEIRQSAFALLGDLARGCYSHLAQQLDEFVALALAALEAPALTHDAMAACNNAAWSLGEMLIKAQPAAVERHALRVAETMAFVLSGAVRVTIGLRENAAIALGRTAWVASAPLAPHLSHFLTGWLAALRTIRDDLEKEQAFLGLCRVVRLNPQPAADAFPALCAALASWCHVRDEGLRHEMGALLLSFRDGLGGPQGGAWLAAVGRLEPPVREKLAVMCGGAL